MATTPEGIRDSGCTLPPDDLRERLAWIRGEVLPHARGNEPLLPGPGHVWTFPRTPERRTQLERLVALESACCRGPVGFQLEEDAAQDVLRLVVRGIGSAADLTG